MQFEKLFRLLIRNDVKEMALQADRPPCVLVENEYVPVTTRNFAEDEVIAALVEANGQAQVLGLVEGGRRWEFNCPGVGKIRVFAGYHEGLLQARFRLIERAAPPPPRPHEPRGKPNPFEAELPLPDAANLAELESELAAEPVEPEPRPIHLGDTADEVIDALLQLARDRGASDVHVLANRSPTLRVAGELTPIGLPLSEQLVEEMLLPRIPERVKQDFVQHGACDFAFSHKMLGRFRANVTRQRTGLKLTARPIQERVPTLADLGMPDSIAAATEHHQGLIVVTGPTGHGKTTTLAALVDIINRERTDHIITVEDPIEYLHPRKRAMISQREVGTHTKTFAAALKGSLREDPDVIVVGELRDTETVRMALSASETGHLVIATMNTPSAAKTIERLIDLFPPGDQPQVRMTLAGSLRLVISQRLVPSSDRRSVHAAVELLPGSPPLWALIRDNKTFQIPSLQQRGKALGIVRLDDSLAELVRGGLTSLEIARDYADAPDQLEALVTGRPLRPAEPGAPAFNAAEASREAAAAAQKLGKDVFSKAGKLFGGDKK